MTFDAFDVVVVPFPFTDRRASKRRPAVVVSRSEALGDLGQSVLAMITSTRVSWPLDVGIVDLPSAGLSVDCAVRMKLFTLDHRLILRRTGRLGERDSLAVTQALRRLMPLSDK